MRNWIALRQWCSASLGEGLDRAFYKLSTIGVPLLLAAATLTAHIAWAPHYPSMGAVSVEVHASRDITGIHSPQDAAVALRSVAPAAHVDTRLSSVPFWFSFKTVTPWRDTDVALEFPSRHATSLSCWDAVTGDILGTATRAGARGGLYSVKAGFALDLGRREPAEYVCRGEFRGPARISVVQWPAAELNRSTAEFHRNSGLLDGGVLVLALFMLVTAMVVRNGTYVLFAAWLLVNLRVAALSAGWDTQWLGRAVPADVLPFMRAITLALCYILTLTLFRTLFRDDIERVGYSWMVRPFQIAGAAALALAVYLPYSTFLPVFWVLIGLGICAHVGILIKILIVTRSKVAMWYSSSLAVLFAASIYEVISASLGFKGLIGAVNSVTAALASSLMAALAIAEQMRIEHNEKLSAQAELAHAYEVMPVGLFTADMSGSLLSVNPALNSMLGRPRNDSSLCVWQSFFPAECWGHLRTAVHLQRDVEIEVRSLPGVFSGEERSFLVKAAYANGKIEGSLQDITEKAKALAELHYMANNDPLTKVYNRRGIEKVLAEGLVALESGQPLTVAFLDLDRFKLINDLYGHTAGDEVLKQVCERVTGMLTEAQQMGRVGGDEFVVVLPNTPVPLASWICRGVVDSIGTSPYRIGDKAFQVRCSIGLIEVAHGTKLKDAVSAAERACREAKTGAGDGLVIYEKHAKAFNDRMAELDLVERLSSGTAPEGLYLEMQPIMSLKAPNDSLNFEVLLRMRDHDGSPIPAGRIIGAAESSGRTGVIDRWVMSTTLSWIAENAASLGSTKFVCMNLSGASLNDERFVQDAYAMLGEYVHVAHRLCLEITESVALHDLNHTRKFIDRVRSFGARVALDDFGAGYTSFTYLRELPADVLKIDGNFVVDINAHPANVAIVEAIVNLASNLGMKTIAEWAEDCATVETLADIGVDYVQGYAVSRPQSPGRLLMAESAATFIQDEKLARLVKQLGSPLAGSGQLDLLDGRPVEDI